jgi:NAD+ synthetase
MLHIALAQINPCLGDFDGNYQKILKYCIQAEKAGADIVVFPELATSGYDPKDLVRRAVFVQRSMNLLKQLLDISKEWNIAIIIGSMFALNQKSDYCRPYNSSFFIHKGQILHQHDKIALPNYGVFDEKRTFTKGRTFESIEFKGYRVGLLVCEDIWRAQISTNDLCDIIVVINASPFSIDKHQERLKMLKHQAISYQSSIVYLNMVGCQDSLVYDGGSIVVTQNGNLMHQSEFFKESMDIVPMHSSVLVPSPQDINNLEHVYHALSLALRDYLYKNNMTDVVLGLSGGIDSALTAVIAIDALGKDKVHLITLPSRYSSAETYQDTKELLTNLGVDATNISIEPIFDASLQTLQGSGKTEENLQSRIRGLILMALSNEHGYMLLSTGNKSELAVGYATLYGDMNGGYNLLKDLYKTDVYNLARWRNEQNPIIPESIIRKDPTAELRPNQKDSDTLPNYDVLDRILIAYIEGGISPENIIRHLNIDPIIVDQVMQLVRIAEFKRHQSTLGPKIRNMSFDLDWRMPITNKFLG